jgi:hypothetical protein
VTPVGTTYVPVWFEVNVLVTGVPAAHPEDA